MGFNTFTKLETVNVSIGMGFNTFIKMETVNVSIGMGFNPFIKMETETGFSPIIRTTYSH
jgi:hypothetical protein